MIFHRVSKLNFLGAQYCLPGAGSTLLAEVTFREGSYLGAMPESEVVDKVTGDLVRLGFIRKETSSTPQFALNGTPTSFTI